MVRRELPALLRLLPAPPAGREDDCRRVDLDALAVLALARRAPAVRRRLERDERVVGQRDAGRCLVRLAQAFRDCVTRPVADLEQALPRRASAAREPVAAVLARELDAELLEPVDRAGRLGGQDLDEPAVRGLVRALPDVLGVLLR
jgi:hypothetical protein